MFVAAVRLFRNLAILNIVELFDKSQVYFKKLNNGIYIFKYFLLLYFQWHWAICLWWFINSKVEPVVYLNQTFWAKEFKLLDQSVGMQYLWSMYFIIKLVTGVGQGDQTPLTNVERGTAMFLITTGDILFCFVFGMICEIQMSIVSKGKLQLFLGRMKEIQHFITSVNANESQKIRI
jgi:hypothetical protein